mgnify:CR=1 FL=1
MKIREIKYCFLKCANQIEGSNKSDIIAFNLKKLLNAKHLRKTEYFEEK